MKKNIRWGIIGPGAIARRFAMALRGVENAELVAVSSRSAERCRPFMEEFGATRCFAAPEELAACRDVDAVYVSTPHPFHHAGARAVLEGGKAVLCEKPITMNAAELEDLIAVAQRNNAFLMEAMWTRFLPVNREVLQWVRQGEIGPLRMIYADFCFSNDFNPASRLFAPELGGGALLDIGIYVISYAQMLAGNPEKITGLQTPAPSGVDGCNAILGSYPRGVLALLSSAMQSCNTNQARICGERGEIIVPNFWSAESATLKRRGESAPSLQSKHPHKVNGFEYEIEEVHRCLAEGKIESSVMPLADSLSLQRQMDQLRATWR